MSLLNKLLGRDKPAATPAASPAQPEPAKHEAAAGTAASHEEHAPEPNAGS